jgi:hypothetical protein
MPNRKNERTSEFWQPVVSIVFRRHRISSETNGPFPQIQCEFTGPSEKLFVMAAARRPWPTLIDARPMECLDNPGNGGG